MEFKNCNDNSQIEVVTFESFNNEDLLSDNHPLNGLMMEED